MDALDYCGLLECCGGLQGSLLAEVQLFLHGMRVRGPGLILSSSLELVQLSVKQQRLTILLPGSIGSSTQSARLKEQ
eukprot:3572211-Amphidinium_carterae.1